MTDRVQRILLWFFAITVVGGTILGLRYATGYRMAAGLAPATTPLPPDVNLRLEKVRAVGRKDGVAAWTVVADRLDTTRNKDRIDFAGNVRAVLLRSGRPHATFTAPHATYTSPTKILSAAGQIVCVVKGEKPKKGQDLRLETQQVTWNVGAKQVLCPGHVKAITGTTVVQGNELTVDLTTRDLEMSRFNATFRTGDADTPTDALGTLKEILR